MFLDVCNATDHVFSLRYIEESGNSHGSKLFLSASASLSTNVPHRRPLIEFTAGTLSNDVVEKEKASLSSFVVRLPRLTVAKARAIPVPHICPCRLYLSRVKKRYYRVTIIPRRDLASFLTGLPDTLRLSSLCLPGTHDTMALYGWPISQCQEVSTPLSVQLQSGIRVLDIRLAIVQSRLIAYHGISSQRASFQEILSTIHAFLSDPATSQETIVMSIKQEDFAVHSSHEFSSLVHKEVFEGPGGSSMWYLRNRIPVLGEVRGKVVLFSRFGENGDGWEGGLEGLGIHPTTWPNSQKYGFEWTCKDSLVRTHDWYNLPSFLSIPEKHTLASQMLLPLPNNPPMPTLSITFFSASSFPFALPPLVAKGFGWPKLGLGVEGMNSRCARFLLDSLDQETHRHHAESLDDDVLDPIRGWALFDFYAEANLDIVPLFVEFNYRGRRSGEEGWP